MCRRPVWQLIPTIHAFDRAAPLQQAGRARRGRRMGQLSRGRTPHGRLQVTLNLVTTGTGPRPISPLSKALRDDRWQISGSNHVASDLLTLSTGTLQAFLRPATYLLQGLSSSSRFCMERWFGSSSSRRPPSGAKFIVLSSPGEGTVYWTLKTLFTGYVNLLQLWWW